MYLCQPIEALPLCCAGRCSSQNVRDLVYDRDGEAVATKLISVLVTEHLDTAASSSQGITAGVDEVAAVLQRDCPSYFKDDDRTFYQVGFTTVHASLESALRCWVAGLPGAVYVGMWEAGVVMSAVRATIQTCFMHSGSRRLPS